MDWSKIDKEDHLPAMECSPIKDVEIKVLLKAALTDQINDREVYMTSIDARYHYGATTHSKQSSSLENRMEQHLLRLNDKYAG